MSGMNLFGRNGRPALPDTSQNGQDAQNGTLSQHDIRRKVPKAPPQSENAAYVVPERLGERAAVSQQSKLLEGNAVIEHESGMLAPMLERDNAHVVSAARPTVSQRDDDPLNAAGPGCRHGNRYFHRRAMFDVIFATC